MWYYTSPGQGIVPVGVYNEPAPDAGPLSSRAFTPVIDGAVDAAVMSFLRDVERMTRLRDKVQDWFSG